MNAMGCAAPGLIRSLPLLDTPRLRIKSGTRLAFPRFRHANS